MVCQALSRLVKTVALCQSSVSGSDKSDLFLAIAGLWTPRSPGGSGTQPNCRPHLVFKETRCKRSSKFSMLFFLEDLAPGDFFGAFAILFVFVLVPVGTGKKTKGCVASGVSVTASRPPRERNASISCKRSCGNACQSCELAARCK